MTDVINGGLALALKSIVITHESQTHPRGRVGIVG